MKKFSEFCFSNRNVIKKIRSDSETFADAIVNNFHTPPNTKHRCLKKKISPIGTRSIQTAQSNSKTKDQ